MRRLVSLVGCVLAFGWWTIPTVAAKPGSEFSEFESKLEEYERDNIKSIHKRIYQKIGRHELSVGSGGVLRSDGFVVGQASYTYHLFESLGFEIIGAYGGQVYDDNTIMYGAGLIEFSPLYGKMTLFEHSILTFDLSFFGGAGMIQARGLDTTTGPMGVLGLGMRFFFSQALAFRIDFRDYFYRDDLNANDFELQNNLTLSGALCIFFPWKVPY